MMAEIDHSRVEDAMSVELRVVRKEASDLRQKLHLLAQEKIELESKLVPYRLKVANLEASMKADAAKVENLEKRSADREVLLGKVEKERDDAVDELVKAREENEKIAAELAQARDEELKKRADELKQQTRAPRLGSVGAVPERLGYSERSRPLRRQLVFHLVLVGLPHHQVAFFKLPQHHLRVISSFNPPFHCLGFYSRLLPDLIQQIHIQPSFLIRVFHYKVLESRRALLDFHWNHCVASIDQAKRGLMGS